MTKKELVLHIIGKLKPYWDKAAALEVVVPFCTDDDALLDMVLTALYQWVKDVWHIQWQAQFERSIDVINKIRAQESASADASVDIDTLLKDI